MDGLLGGNLNHVQDNLKLYNEGVAMASGALVWHVSQFIFKISRAFRT